MEFLNSPYFILCSAVILDFIIGDPEYRFHPIRLIGSLISKCEESFRKISANQKFNGFLFTFFIVGITFLLGYLLTLGGWFVELFLVYSCIAVGDLRQKAFEIKKLLIKDEISDAQKAVSMIVGRDTENLDKKEIVRAIVETIAENIVDGIISPLFYFAIGGTPLMLAYKAINTLDSMVGYKNDKYRDLGFASAKIDDIANFIPARLSLFIISLSGLFTGKNIYSGIKIGLRDGQKNPSPNSGISEAVVAGLLNIQLGGTNYYFGKKSVKPIIGENREELNKKHISQSVNIAYISCLVTTCIIVLVYYQLGI